MRHLKILSICLVALAFQGTAWAEIYETQDAEGNPEFTNAPPGGNAKEINLPQTNVVDAPAPDSSVGSQDQAEPAAASQPPPVEQNNIDIQRDVDDDGGYQNDDYVDGVDQREIRRDEAVYGPDPDAPHEVGDSNAQMPREVGDTNAQMPREVGDTNAQMPREVGDSPPISTGELRR